MGVFKFDQDNWLPFPVIYKPKDNSARYFYFLIRPKMSLSTFSAL
jgi:hypothetical protein